MLNLNNSTRISICLWKNGPSLPIVGGHRLFRRLSNHSANNQSIKHIETIRKLFIEAEQQKTIEPNNQLYKIYGWIRGRIQRQKTKWFFHLDDGSNDSRLQVIIPSSVLNKEAKSLLQNGTSLECIGHLEASLGHQQSVDFHCESFRVIGTCPPDDYQIGHLKTGLEFDLLRERIHLRPRVQYFQSILRIRNELIKSIHSFMEQNEFIQVQVPLITANDCEGGGECFTLKPANWSNEKFYFGRPTYLSVSGQLHLEALASSLSRVYTLSQVFRAEKSMSPKHLSEFLMLELEECFLFELEPLLDRVENLYKHLLEQIEQKCPNDLGFLLDKNDHRKKFDQLKNTKNFIRIPYSQAVEILSEKYPQLKDKNMNLNAEMERHLLSMFDDRPVFITEFPLELKPFYMKCSSNHPQNGAPVAQCFDLLSPICGEVCGGSLRENHLSKLKEQIRLKFGDNSNEASLNWYMDLRKYGSAPSGGFGLGFDRFIQTICGVQNIKDVIPFPRWPYHCYL